MAMTDERYDRYKASGRRQRWLSKILRSTHAFVNDKIDGINNTVSKLRVRLGRLLLFP